MKANVLIWKLDRTVELKYQYDTYPLVAITPDGQYRIIKIVGGYSAKFILTGHSVAIGRRVGDSSTLREARRVCEEDFLRLSSVNP